MSIKSLSPGFIKGCVTKLNISLINEITQVDKDAYEERQKTLSAYNWYIDLYNISNYKKWIKFYNKVKKGKPDEYDKDYDYQERIIKNVPSDENNEGEEDDDNTVYRHNVLFREDRDSETEEEETEETEEDEETEEEETEEESSIQNFIIEDEEKDDKPLKKNNLLEPDETFFEDELQYEYFDIINILKNIYLYENELDIRMTELSRAQEMFNCIVGRFNKGFNHTKYYDSLIEKFKKLSKIFKRLVDVFINVGIWECDRLITMIQENADNNLTGTYIETVEELRQKILNFL